MEGKDDSTNERVNSLLLVNQLDYRLPPSLSVAVSRSHASYQSNQQTYTSGQLLSVTMSSGGQYVNFRESYLRFTVNVTADQVNPGDGYALIDQRSWGPDPYNPLTQAGNPPPGRNGATNLFSTQRWVHSSGTVIDEQIQDLDLWSYIRQRYTSSSDKRASCGSLHQYGSRSWAETKFLADGTVQSKDFLLPLSEISDAFDQPQLAPAFIVAGSRLELRLNEFGRAFVSTEATQKEDAAVGNVAFTISNVELVLQQIQLTDSIQRALQNISASSGLEYPFISVAVNSAQNPQGSGSIQVSRSLSRANCVCVVRRNNDQLSGAKRYHLQSAAPGNKKIVSKDTGGRYSVQLGGQQIPQSPVRTEQEAFWHALVSWGCAFDPSRCPEVSFEDFSGQSVYQPAVDQDRRISDAIYCVSLETSSTLNQSGSALSAQRVLVFDYKNVELPEPGTGVTYTMFTPHVRLVTAYLDSLIARS
jgi:hypothetical protein